MFCDATATDDLKLINEGGSEPRVMVSTAAFHAFELGVRFPVSAV